MRATQTQARHSPSPYARTAGHGQEQNRRFIKEIRGAAKGAVGKAIGDAKLQNDGKTEKAVGKIQNAVGGLNDGGARRWRRNVTATLQTTLTCPEPEI